MSTRRFIRRSNQRILIKNQESRIIRTLSNGNFKFRYGNKIANRQNYAHVHFVIFTKDDNYNFVILIRWRLILQSTNEEMNVEVWRNDGEHFCSRTRRNIRDFRYYGGTLVPETEQTHLKPVWIETFCVDFAVHTVASTALTGLDYQRRSKETISALRSTRWGLRWLIKPSLLLEISSTDIHFRRLSTPWCSKISSQTTQSARLSRASLNYTLDLQPSTSRHAETSQDDFV